MMSQSGASVLNTVAPMLSASVVDSFRLMPTAFAAVMNKSAALTSTAVSAIARIRNSSGLPSFETRDAVTVAPVYPASSSSCPALPGLLSRTASGAGHVVVVAECGRHQRRCLARRSPPSRARRAARGSPRRTTPGGSPDPAADDCPWSPEPSEQLNPIMWNENDSISVRLDVLSVLEPGEDGRRHLGHDVDVTGT